MAIIGIGNQDLLRRKGVTKSYRTEGEALGKFNGGDTLVVEKLSPLAASLASDTEYNVRVVKAADLPDTSLSPDEINKAEYLAGEGFNASEIAKALGTSVSDVAAAQAIRKVLG